MNIYLFKFKVSDFFIESLLEASRFMSALHIFPDFQNKTNFRPSLVQTPNE